MRKAATASYMTQPAATKLIHELEEMFRVVLFQRNRRGMQLTPHGEILRRHIGIVMADIGNISWSRERPTNFWADCCRTSWTSLSDECCMPVILRD